jgi:uncharacterized membrane protein/uncharacterized protein (DUF1330 family)
MVGEREGGRHQDDDRVKDYLRRVEAALERVGADCHERAGILADLEGQIADMVARAPAPADIPTLLARLDPPEAYARAVREMSAADDRKAMPAPAAAPIGTSATKPRNVNAWLMLVGLALMFAALCLMASTIAMMIQSYESAATAAGAAKASALSHNVRLSLIPMAIGGPLSLVGFVLFLIGLVRYLLRRLDERRARLSKAQPAGT